MKRKDTLLFADDVSFTTLSLQSLVPPPVCSHLLTTFATVSLIPSIVAGGSNAELINEQPVSQPHGTGFSLISISVSVLLIPSVSVAPSAVELAELINEQPLSLPVHGTGLTLITTFASVLLIPSIIGAPDVGIEIGKMLGIAVGSDDGPLVGRELGN